MSLLLAQVRSAGTSAIAPLLGYERTYLVPNFTEQRVKRFARILESNESLIDDLWQLAV
jgi:hypothetical protein